MQFAIIFLAKNWAGNLWLIANGNSVELVVLGLCAGSIVTIAVIMAAVTALAPVIIAAMTKGFREAGRGGKRCSTG